ncbi:hypothetical protein G3I40_36190, partial [Streptomyces sp. SID14478]|nr:hypothetical protein [Streptomyces sp. SID14478]
MTHLPSPPDTRFDHSPAHRAGRRTGPRTVLAVVVVTAVAAGGAYAAGLGPFARGD